MMQNDLDQRSAEAWRKRLNNMQFAYSESLTLLKLSEELAYGKGIADACKTLGYCYWRFSDYSLSLSHSLKALSIYQSLDDKAGEADSLNNIGAVYMFQNDHKKRLEVNLKCKEIRISAGDLEGAASSEGNIGETYLEMGDLDKAEERFYSVLKDPHASPQGSAWSCFNLGRIYQIRGDYATAKQRYLESLDISLSVEYNVLITESLLNITELALLQGNWNEGLKHAEHSLSVSREIGAKEGEKRSLLYLSQIYEHFMEFETSLKYHKDFHTIDLEISRDREIERLKTMQLEVAYKQIGEQKKELIDSIKYAERIQTAVLERDQNQKLLGGYFVVYKPKDIVSGDFYWYHEKEDYFYVCVADCTGHGVPGALLTILGTTFLGEIITQLENPTPAVVLDKLREQLVRSLAGRKMDITAGDGMDVSLLRFDVRSKSAVWAGAYNPLWIVRSSKKGMLETESKFSLQEHASARLFELKGDRFPVGKMDIMPPFTDHFLQLNIGDMVYLLTDGFADQFGGEKGKKFRATRLKETLLELQDISAQGKGQKLDDIFEEWRGEQDQVDDVCVFGIEIIELFDE